MKVVVGLGNPGPKYAGTRHNVGFEVVDYLAAAPGCSAFRERFEALVAETKERGETVLLAKPLTFMNLSGRTVRQVVEEGIADQIKSKLNQYGPGGGENVGTVLASGRGDLGFQQVSEFVDTKGIEYVGPLPADIQQVTIFSAGLFRSASAPVAAKALVKFLTSREAAPILKRHGLDPG